MTSVVLFECARAPCVLLAVGLAICDEFFLLYYSTALLHTPLLHPPVDRLPAG